MRIRTRVESLERRASPTGECRCGENPKGDMLLCRDPSVPPPPRRVCARCGRVVFRVILGPVAPGEPAYERVTNLREYVIGTALPAYGPADAGTIAAMMAPPGYEPADAGTVRRMADGEPV